MLTTRLVSAYPFLAGLSPRSRSLLESSGGYRTLKRRDTLIRQGNRVDGMLLVISGRLRIFMISERGEEATLYYVQRGGSCLFTTSALFTEMRFPAHVEVDTKEAKIFNIPARVFRTLHREEATVRDFTVTELSSRVFDLLAALEERSLRSLDDRLRGYLVRQMDPQGEVHATHEQIAHWLGTAREVVTRKLSLLARAGQIQTRRGRIRILNAARW